MQVQMVPLGSDPVGPQTWRDATVRSIQRAQRLIQQTRTGRSRSASWTPKRTEGSAETGRNEVLGQEELFRTTKSRSRTRREASSGSQTSALFSPSGFRERCAAESTALVGEYMRGVREVEVQLRRQAASVTEEWTKLERERVRLEKVLLSIRTNLTINQRSSEGRSRRPVTMETERDAADHLLLWERGELMELKRELEKELRECLNQLQALGDTSRQLLICANERSRVLDLLPHRGSTGPNGTTSQAFIKTDPVSPFTPEAKQVLDSSFLTMNQSQLLRENIKQALSGATTRQNAAQRTVNHSLVKKIAETIGLQRSLTVTSAATRQAAFRKQREVNAIRHSHDRAQGPEHSGDVPTREKPNRPLVQVYQRHPGTQFPEAGLITQGRAVLRRCLKSSEGEMGRLQRSGLQLMSDLRNKSAAAQVDAAVVRMRRERDNKRAVLLFSSRGRIEPEGTHPRTKTSEI